MVKSGEGSGTGLPCHVASRLTVFAVRVRWSRSVRERSDPAGRLEAVDAPGETRSRDAARSPAPPAESLRQSLVRLGAAVTGDLETGHDLAQEALLALSQRDDVRDAPAWLRRVVVNRGRSWLRRRARHQAYLNHWERWRRERADQLTETDLADQLAVREALGRLSPEHRAVLVLRFYDDLSVPQIAATLKVAEGTVKSRLHRGLARMKEAVDVED